MSIRAAILQAADHIENQPTRFRFLVNHVPSVEDACGCALGWIGYFSNKYPTNTFGYSHLWGVTVENVARDFLGIETPEHRALFSAVEFYERMNVLCGAEDDQWTASPKLCAKALRAYADKYHPEGIPESVREIFSGSALELAPWPDYQRAYDLVSRLSRSARRTPDDVCAVA
jgi:hypothetical protein